MADFDDETITGAPDPDSKYEEEIEVFEEIKKKTPKQSATKSLSKLEVSAKWTEGRILALIQAIEPHQSIWNFACAEHKNLTKRESAWRDIDVDVEKQLMESKTKVGQIKVPSTNPIGFSGVLCNSWPPTRTFASAELLASGDDSSPLSSTSDVPKRFTSGSGSAVRKRKQSAIDIQQNNANMQKAMNVLNSAPDDQYTCVGTMVGNELREFAQKNSAFAARAKRKVLQLMCALGEEMDAVVVNGSKNK